MRILNRKDFLALPSGVLFSKYEPCVFGPLTIKWQTLETNDFIDQCIADAVKHDNEDGFSDVLHMAQETGSSIQMDFDCSGRDGEFDNDQLFAVWEKADIQALIVLLMNVLVSGK